MKVFALAVLVVAVATVQTNAQTITQSFSATADSTIYSNNVDNNGGGNLFGIAGFANNGNERRFLTQFDLSSIAPGSIVTSASLDLNVAQSNSGGGNFELYRVDTAWNEGIQSGNQGAAATTGEVTWNEAQNGLVDWTDGGSFFSPVLSQASITSNGPATLTSSADFVSAVQALVDDPTSNFGFILVGQDPGSALRFDTSDAGVAPSLSVSFTSVPEPTTGLLGLSLLGGLLLQRRKR